MKAIVLAGGKGVRLQPLTLRCPKPLLPVATRPMLDYVTSQLVYYGLNTVCYAVAYQREQIEGRVAKYRGVDTVTLAEEEPLGTAGCVIGALELLDDPFVVVSGDCLNNVDLGRMMDQHKQSGKAITIATVEVEDTRKYGVVSVRNGEVVSLIEKPQTNEYGSLVNAGIYVISKRALTGKKGVLDFAKDVFPKWIAKQEVGAYEHNGYWTDIGGMDEYYAANFDMSKGAFFPFVEVEGEGEPRFSGGSVFAYDCVVNGAVSGGMVCRGAVLAQGASITDTIVLPGVRVGGKHVSEIIGNGFSVTVARRENDRSKTAL